MGQASSHNGKIITFADPTPQQRAAAKARSDARRAVKLAAKAQMVKAAKLIIPPTQDPKHAGALWNNNGILAISIG